MNYRNNSIYSKTALSLLTLSSGIILNAQDAKHPNIILFMVDDMGWQDTSEPFWRDITPYNELCNTPNMERLAKEGMKFTKAYACAISSPTRTSLMTGMNAARHNVTNWTLNRDSSTDARDDVLEFPKWNVNGLQPSGSEYINNAVYATTLAQILKDNNYYTIHCGKAHWGAKSTVGANPINLGFDVNIAGSEIGGLASYYAKDNFGKGAFHVTGLEKYYGTDIHISEALTREAIDKLKHRPHNRPFYLYMAHYAVHIPIQIDNRFKNNPKYKDCSGAELAYLTMIEGMDKSLGDLMDYLEDNNLTENSVIVFMSDNGGHHSIGNIHKNGKFYKHNYPLNGSKGSAFEGGIREPMIVKIPNITKSGTTTDQPIIIEDFFPTILDIAGVKNYNTTQQLDGKSFFPLLKNDKNFNNKKRYFFWHYPNKWGEFTPGSDAYSSVISGDFKLIYRWKNSKFELFNIKKDIGEKENLLVSHFAKYHRKAKRMAGTLSNYLREAKAMRPTYRKNKKLVPYPDEVKIEMY